MSSSSSSFEREKKNVKRTSSPAVLKSSGTSGSGSSNNDSPAAASTPTPTNFDVTAQGVTEWAQGMGIREIDKDVLRTITRGPFNDFLQQFCLPHVRSDKWIAAMRLNLDLQNSTGTSDDVGGPIDVKMEEVESELQKYRNELAALENEEDSLISHLKDNYDAVANSSLPELLKSEEEKITLEKEKAYLLTLKKSHQLKKNLLPALVQKSTDKENHEGADQAHAQLPVPVELDLPETSVLPFDSLNAIVSSVVKKYLYNSSSVSATASANGSTDENELIRNVEMLKATVQAALKKLNCTSDHSWYSTALSSSTRSSDGSSSPRIPSTQFSSGLKEFHSVIFQKLLEWAQFHLDLHELNEANGLMNVGLFDSIVENSFEEQSSVFADENSYLKFLIQEEKLKETLRFYQALNIDEYTEKILSNTTTDKISNLPAPANQLLPGVSSEGESSRRRSNCNNKSSSLLPLPLLNYEKLVELLLNLLLQHRTQIKDGLIWSNVTCEAQVEQYLEATQKLLNG